MSDNEIVMKNFLKKNFIISSKGFFKPTLSIVSFFKHQFNYNISPMVEKDQFQHIEYITSLHSIIFFSYFSKMYFDLFYFWMNHFIEFVFSIRNIVYLSPSLGIGNWYLLFSFNYQKGYSFCCPIWLWMFVFWLLVLNFTNICFYCHLIWLEKIIVFMFSLVFHSFPNLVMKIIFVFIFTSK